jgi:hypothetical protein
MPRGNTAGFVALWTRFAVHVVEPGGGLTLAVDAVTRRNTPGTNSTRPCRA